MKADRPNIVWIYCDELRTDALACYGHPTLHLHTPNLDRLAGSGVRFTNNFCNSPVCVSSRVCVLTGRHPEDTGVYNNEGAWRNFRLPEPLLTFPEVFAGNGYRTANFGKIHVTRDMMPGAKAGGDIFQVHDGEGGGMAIWQHLGEEAVQMIRAPHGGMNGGIFPDEEPYPPDTVVNNGLDWMREQESPFLVRLSILQPHTPVLPPARFVKLYDGQDPGLPDPLPETASAFEQRVAEMHALDRMDPDMLRAARLHYYAQVAWVDEQVGLVLDFLEAQGQMDRTIIMFGADHGNPIGDTGAFGKHTFAPTVHRVPLLVSWPGSVPAGEVRDDICDSLDVGRTLMGMAGLECPDSFKGRDLFRDPPPEILFSTIGYGEPDSWMGPNGGRGDWYGGRGWPRRSCARTACFRLDKNTRLDGRRTQPEDEDVFLADVQADPAERVNLAGDPAHVAIADTLARALDRLAEGAVEIPPECLVR